MADENTNTETDSERNLTKLLGKKDGDAMALAADLLTENAQLRADKRALNGQLTVAQDKLPADGSLVLGKADAERYNLYKNLGTVDEVTAKVNGYGDLETKEKSRTRADAIKALGFKPSIFELIAEGNPYRVVGEADERKVYVTVNDKEQELTTYAQERGLNDLLGVMGLSAAPQAPLLPTPTGAGNRNPAPPQDPVDALNKQLYGGQK